MRLHRFISSSFDLSSKTLTVSDTEFLKQWRNVLRLQSGDSVILSDGKGREARGLILALDHNEASIKIEEVTTPLREPKKQTTLFCAVLKRENFELVIQKATEIGITRIVPIITERTIKTGHNHERLEKIIREAAEQSGRTTIPHLEKPIPFKEALESSYAKTALLFDLSGEEVGLTQGSLLPTSCFIGPEGGFSEAEVILAREKGLSIGLLGTLTLRGETAAIIAAYLITR